jgi:hypothetical protein
MRTKTLLLTAAAIAAGVITSQAQSNVYSANVVGYVNVVIRGSGAYNFVANPLSNSVANYNTNLFPGPLADGCSILKWDSANATFQGAIPTYYTEISAWDSDASLPVGEGFFFVNPGTDFTNTFVGEVIQGSFSQAVAGAGAYNAFGSSAPVGGSFTNAVQGCIPTDGDSILTWDYSMATFQGDIPTYYTEISAWDRETPDIKVGDAFFYVRTGDPYTWVRNFTVQ